MRVSIGGVIATTIVTSVDESLVGMTVGAGEDELVTFMDIGRKGCKSSSANEGWRLITDNNEWPGPMLSNGNN